MELHCSNCTQPVYRMKGIRSLIHEYNNSAHPCFTSKAEEDSNDK